MVFRAKGVWCGGAGWDANGASRSALPQHAQTRPQQTLAQSLFRSSFIRRSRPLRSGEQKPSASRERVALPGRFEPVVSRGALLAAPLFTPTHKLWARGVCVGPRALSLASPRLSISSLLLSPPRAVLLDRVAQAHDDVIPVARKVGGSQVSSARAIREVERPRALLLVIVDCQRAVGAYYHQREAGVQRHRNHRSTDVD